MAPKPPAGLALALLSFAVLPGLPGLLLPAVAGPERPTRNTLKTDNLRPTRPVPPKDPVGTLPKTELGEVAEIFWNEKTRVPRQIRGRKLHRRDLGLDDQADRDQHTARAFLRKQRLLLQLRDPDQELKLERTHRDDRGRTYLRFSQLHQGIPVWPAEVIAELDPEGDVDLVTGGHVPTPGNVVMTPVVDAQTAVDRARAAVAGEKRVQISNPTLIIYAPPDRLPRLAWKIEVTLSLASRWLVFVDALQGIILDRHSLVRYENLAGTGTDALGVSRALNLWHEGLYYPVDTSKPMFNAGASDPPARTTTMGGLVVLDGQLQDPNSPSGISTLGTISFGTPTIGSQNPDAVSAAYGLSQAYDYFLLQHGRDSYDGQGATITAVIRLAPTFNSAFWSNGTAYFGTTRPYVAELDILGHEVTHGVTETTANLIYQNQSGALSEAFSDIFGEMIEARAKGGQPDWRKGGAAIGGVTLQDYASPASVECRPGVPCPAKYSDYYSDAEGTDFGGVHTNSNIISHAYYLLAQGLAGAIGIPDAEQIFYCALTTKLVPQSQFVDARLGAVACAQELFGTEAPQVQRVREAFDAVEISDAPATIGPPPFAAVNAPDSTLFLAQDSRGQTGPYVGRRETAQGDDPAGVALSPSVSLLEAGDSSVTPSSLSVTGDGSKAYFVNGNHSICEMVTADGTGTCAGFPGGNNVQAVAISRDGQRLAHILLDDATPGPFQIVVTPLTSGTPTIFPITAPNLEGGSSAQFLAMNSFQFTADGRAIIFDALTSVTIEAGTSQTTWNLYVLDLSSGGQAAVQPLVPAVSGRDHQFPLLSQTSDSFFTFESYDPTTGQITLMAANRFTGQASVIGALSASPVARPRPGYNGDDTAIIYAAPSMGSCLRIPLAGDRLTPSGQPETWLTDASYCRIYRRGPYTGPQFFLLFVTTQGTGSGQVISAPAGILCSAGCKAEYQQGQIVTLVAQPASNSHFEGWGGDLDCTDGVVTMSAARTCTATFGLGASTGAIALTVTKAGAGDLRVTSSPPGLDCGVTCLAGFPPGTQVALIVAQPANPGGGVVLPQLAGWGGDPDCADGSVTVNAPKSCTATFAYPGNPQTGTVQVGVSGAGGLVTSFPSGIACTNSPALFDGRTPPCQGVFAAGSTVYLRATTTSSASFNGWSGGCSGTGNCAVQVSAGGSIAVTATFVDPGTTVPVGDSPSSPILVRTETFTDTRSVESYTAAANDPAQSCFTGFDPAARRSIFYEFTPARSGRLIVRTTGSNYDTGLSVYLASTDLHEIACNDNDTSTGLPLLTSRVELTVSAGLTYLIQISKRESEQTALLNTLSFSLRLLPGASSDTPFIIPQTPFTDSRSVVEYNGAAGGSMVLSCGPATPTHPIFYQFTPVVPGTVILTTKGSEYDTVLGLFQRTATATPGVFQDIELPGGCNDDVRTVPPIDPSSRLVARLRAGQTYLIRVDSFGSEVGSLRLALAFFADTSTQYPLKVTSAGTGTGTISETQGLFTAQPAFLGNVLTGTRVLLQAQAAPGSQFAGWSGDECTGTGACSVVMDRARTIVANFAPSAVVTATLTVAITGSGAGATTVRGDDSSLISCPPSCTTTVQIGSVQTVVATVSGPPAVFSGWTGCDQQGGSSDGTSGTSCLVTITGDRTITATATQVVYLVVTVPPGSGGRVVSTPPGIDCVAGLCAALFQPNQVVTLNATPSQVGGRVLFSGCDGQDVPLVERTTCPVTLFGKRSVSTIFTPANLFVSISKQDPTDRTQLISEPSGIDCGARCGALFPANETIRFTPSNAVFQYQGITCGGATPVCTLALTFLRLGGPSVPQSGQGGFGEVAAQMSMQPFTLEIRRGGSGSGSVRSDPRGMDCLALVCSQQFNEGSIFSLLAESDAGSVFAGWEGCDAVLASAATTCMVEMTRSHSVAATFSSSLHTLTVTRSGGGSGTLSTTPTGINACPDPSCAANFDSGAAIRLKAQAPVGSLFLGWQGCDAEDNGDCLVTMSTPRTVGAKFRALPVKKPRPSRTAPR